MTPIPPPETYFSGKQLALAQLVDTADAAAVHAFAKTMSLDELNTYGNQRMLVLLYAGRKAYNNAKGYAVVTALIKAGADPVLYGEFGDAEASLMDWARGDAYSSRNLGLLKAALDAGVNPDAGANYESEGPIILTVSHQGGLGAMRLLVEYGADVNRRSSIGTSAISDSIMTLGLDEVSFLLDHGANPKVVDYYGFSFAHMLNDKISNLKAMNDPYKRLPQALAIRDRIIAMGVQWPPETPEQLRARYSQEYKQKTGKDYVFMPDEGYQAFVPPYEQAPARKVPLER